LHVPDWVTVVPLTTDEMGRDCFFMVEQYPHGSGNVTMEFPAGTVDPGEDPYKTAARELREETGYCAGTLTQIGALSPNPAFMSNTTYTFLARDLRYEGEQQLDVHESINIHPVPVDDVRGSMGTPPYNNAIMVAALALYERWEED
ncbi:MAG: NUDIX hydrolase, partial [Spirochaetia bacterium]